MVKLYELRINNFFEIELAPTMKREARRVREIRQKHVLLDEAWYHLEKLIPISVTEELLLKCGFTKLKWITESNVFEHGDINCRLDENGLQVFGPDFNNLKPLKYLHELQNLYFDLTEKELQVRLNENEEPAGEEYSLENEKNYVLLSSNA